MSRSALWVKKPRNANKTAYYYGYGVMDSTPNSMGYSWMECGYLLGNCPHQELWMRGHFCCSPFGHIWGEDECVFCGHEYVDMEKLVG